MCRERERREGERDRSRGKREGPETLQGGGGRGEKVRQKACKGEKIKTGQAWEIMKERERRKREGERKGVTGSFLHPISSPPPPPPP